MIERQETIEEQTQPVAGQAVMGQPQEEATKTERKQIVSAWANDAGTELKKLFIGNPMQMEVTRFRRRFINVTQSPKLNQALVGLVAFSYLLILGIIFAGRADVPVAGVAAVQLALMFLAAIVASHASIAGEKDRRSWDLLQVAPITEHQVVVGKFIGSATLLLSIQLALLPAILIAAFGGASQHITFIGILASELACLSWSLFASAATIFLSSKAKNANSALVTSIGAGVGLYLILPILIAALQPDGRLMESIMIFYHPFFWLFAYELNDNAFHALSWGIQGSLIYLLIAAGLLFMTGSRLTRLRGRE